MTERVERFEIKVNTTRDEIWRCLTTDEGLASWFGTGASIDLHLGGHRAVSWGEVVIDARIADFEPGDRIRLVYVEGDAEVGAEEWLISSDGAATRVTLIHSMSDDGVDDWDGFYGDIRRGWNLFLASLKFALEDATTSDRTTKHAYIPATGDRSHIWVGIEGLADSSLAEGMTVRLADPPHSLLITRPDRSILVDIEGSGADQAVYFQASCHGPTDDNWLSEALAAAMRLGT